MLLLNMYKKKNNKDFYFIFIFTFLTKTVIIYAHMYVRLIIGSWQLNK